ncbi:hypothetical protein NFX46_21595 [Streptomyces phaeoluteigriseus]|uniref:Uncharacterized protein n=1 Tax=Streptomyces phaeoluteigriseus TaxID=114686 RepID=A0ABY4ZAL9_9ACTN|nr:hypothetical protein [Streptomyces phaeoluteigriseus]USQ86078.1 hypothetical protein NFX46_21595 [Streptomyces phaeoluteigriseus]
MEADAGQVDVAQVGGREVVQKCLRRALVEHEGLMAQCQADGAAHLSHAKLDEDDDVRVEGLQSAADCAGPVVGTFARVAFTWAVAH